MSLDRLKELASIAYKDYATTEDVGRFFKNLLSSVQETRRDLTAKIEARLAEIRDGVDGKDGKDGKDGAVGPRGPQGERGPVGRALFAPKGDPGAPGKDGSPDTPVQVRDKLETLGGDERLDASAIKGLPEFQQETHRVISGGLTRMKTDSLYTKYHGGASNIYVSATEPENPEVGDLWVDTS